MKTRDALAARVAGWMSRHGMTAPGERVVAAVSGGSDSVALLLLLQMLAETEGWQLGVAHFDHGWRQESEAEAVFVRDLAARLELPFFLKRAEAGAKRSEAAGRQARYAFFQELLVQGEATRIATGHTADDQAETVLLRLLRGAGTGGLAGILPVRRCTPGQPGTVIRPLLATSRPALREWLRAQGQSWREDPSNDEDAYLRNRVRQRLLPALAATGGAAMGRRLCQLAEVARAEEEFWARYLEALGLWEACGQGWRAERQQLQALPLGARRRGVREGMRKAGSRLGQVDFVRIEGLIEWLGDGQRHPRRLRLGGIECRLGARYLELGVAP